MASANKANFQKYFW